MAWTSAALSTEATVALSCSQSAVPSHRCVSQHSIPRNTVRVRRAPHFSAFSGGSLDSSVFIRASSRSQQRLPEKQLIATLSKARLSVKEAPVEGGHGCCLEWGLQSCWESEASRYSVTSLTQRLYRVRRSARELDGRRGLPKRPTMSLGFLIPGKHFIAFLYAFACFAFSLSFGIKLFTDAYDSSGECHTPVCLLGKRPPPRGGPPATPDPSLGFGLLGFTGVLVFAEGVKGPHTSASVPHSGLSSASSCRCPAARVGGEVCPSHWASHRSCLKPSRRSFSSGVSPRFSFPVRSSRQGVRVALQPQGFLSPLPEAPFFDILSSCSPARERTCAATLRAAVRQDRYLSFSDHSMQPPCDSTSCFGSPSIRGPMNGLSQSYRKRVLPLPRKSSAIPASTAFCAAPASSAATCFLRSGLGSRPFGVPGSVSSCPFSIAAAAPCSSSSPSYLTRAAFKAAAVQRSPSFASLFSHAALVRSLSSAPSSLASASPASSVVSDSTPSGQVPAWLPYSFPERLLPLPLRDSRSFEALRTARDHFRTLLRNDIVTPPPSCLLSSKNLDSDGSPTATTCTAPLTERHRDIFLGFADVYAAEVANSGTVTAQEYIDMLASIWQLAWIYAGYPFRPFHEAITTPFNFSEWSKKIWRPLVHLSTSKIVVPPSNLVSSPLGFIKEKLEAGDSVVFLSNHQTEPDPQVIKLVFEHLGEKDLGEQIVFVAGHKVREDHLSTPFSMACSLICVHSKKHVSNPQLPAEERHRRQRENVTAMAALQQLLEAGKNIIWVAPSGGRDRQNAEGRFSQPDAFDVKTVQMFRLLSKKVRHATGRKTHFFPMALFTAPICPPPQQVEQAVGEARTCARSPVGLAVGQPVVDDETLTHEEFTKRAEAEARRLYQLIIP